MNQSKKKDYGKFLITPNIIQSTRTEVVSRSYKQEEEGAVIYMSVEYTKK